MFAKPIAEEEDTMEVRLMFYSIIVGCVFKYVFALHFTAQCKASDTPKAVFSIWLLSFSLRLRICLTWRSHSFTFRMRSRNVRVGAGPPAP